MKYDYSAVNVEEIECVACGEARGAALGGFGVFVSCSLSARMFRL